MMLTTTPMTMPTMMPITNRPVIFTASDAETYRPIVEIVDELKVIEAEARETDKALKGILEKIGI